MMSLAESTCWTVIQAAAEGDTSEREHFARRYEPVIRAYFSARWRTSPLRSQLDDAVQDVFLECFKTGGVLERAEMGRMGGFRPFLYGVVRNVARRMEESKRPPQESGDSLHNLVDPEASVSNGFDRAWAKAIMREAAQRQTELARTRGQAAVDRVELLRLRFHDGLPIREIASRWHVDAAILHHEYAKARQEFRAALLDVMAFHHPGSPADVEQACKQLLLILE